MLPRGTPRDSDTKVMAAALALPSSCGAVTRIRSTPSLNPKISALEALGWTLTDKVQTCLSGVEDDEDDIEVGLPL